MMVRECRETDRELLFAYLKEEAAYNTFLLADISDFGFEESFQTVYMEEDQGKIKGVYLCFYQNFLLYCKDNDVNIPFLEQLLSVYSPDVVMGKVENIQVVSRILTEYFPESRNLYLFQDSGKLPTESLQIQRAQEKDAEDIFTFLQSIPELRHLYTSKEMIAERLGRNCGVHYLIRKNGRIVAHANSAAESRETVMIGGVACAPEYRGRGYAGQLVGRLCRDIREKGKQPCLFCMRGEEHNLYRKIGFRKIGNWGTLTKTFGRGETEHTEKEEEDIASLPTYLSVYNHLYDDIVEGVYAKGSLLPSENILSEKYHVSRNTLRQALAILSQDGYIYKRQGKGTLISYDAERRQREKFHNFLLEDALEKIQNITMSCNIDLPTQIARAKLRLSEGENVLAGNMVYEGESGPIGQSFFQIPIWLLEEKGFSFTGKSVNGNQNDPGEQDSMRAKGGEGGLKTRLEKFLWKGIYDLASGSEMNIQIIEADEQVIPYLHVETGTILLHFEQILSDKEGKPLARIKYYFRQGKYQICCKW